MTDDGSKFSLLLGDKLQSPMKKLEMLLRACSIVTFILVLSIVLVLVAKGARLSHVSGGIESTTFH
jgi:hypothetical protein